MKQFFFLLFLENFYSIIGNCQSQFPPCLNELIAKIAEQHKKNPCEGSDKLIRIEEYNYRDTSLYKLVFETKTFCPDYIRSTIYYDANCREKIRINDGGLMYRHQIIPAGTDEKEIKFVKVINWTKSEIQQDNSENISQLTIDEKGKELKKFYLSLNVENLWIAGSHINWETGVADKPDATAGNHTHCSAFVASACKQLGIYILRPPDHGQILLANAQYDWLQTKEARKDRWELLSGKDRSSVYIQAQNLANHGKVVVAIIKNSDPSKPGHAALIMPRETDINVVEENGPFLIMAGKHNFNLISLKNGFKSHLTTWPENEILFYVNSQ